MKNVTFSDMRPIRKGPYEKREKILPIYLGNGKHARSGVLHEPHDRKSDATKRSQYDGE